MILRFRRSCPNLDFCSDKRNSSQIPEEGLLVGGSLSDIVYFFVGE